jgi:hypothetical protein
MSSSVHRNPISPECAAAGASGFVHAITLWGLMMPLALLAFVVAEIIPFDMVDAVNGLVYGLAAWVALALARLNVPGYVDRLLWLSLAFACVIFGMLELGSNLVENGTLAVWPAWLGDTFCWALTGGFILVILWRRPQVRAALPFVVNLALVGFALHTLSLGLDLGESRLSDLLGLDPQRFDNLSDLVEFICLECYLLAFIMLTAALAGRQALREQIAAAEAAAVGGATIHAAQMAFATATLTTGLFSPRRRQQAILALSAGAGLGGWLAALSYTWRLGRRVAAISGKSPMAQFREQIGLMNRHRLIPKNYYMFELWRPELAARAGEFLQRGETKGAAYKILRRDAVGGNDLEQRLSDKLTFHNRCRQLGLSTVPIHFATSHGTPAEVAGNGPFLPPQDLFIKPRKGCGGSGASRWLYEAGLRPGYRGGDGVRRSEAELRAEILRRAQARDLIVQPRLVNHPELADLNCGALATVRVVTCRDENGRFEVTNAAFRMPRSERSVVDNFHAGGIAAAVEIGSGALGEATDMGLSPRSAWFSHHPTSGAAIAGRILPHWRAVCELALRAHAAFDNFTVIGWDIAILADGPCIIEANGAPDLDIIQRTTRRPLGNGRLGILMSHHLKQRLGPVLLEPQPSAPSLSEPRLSTSGA